MVNWLNLGPLILILLGCVLFLTSHNVKIVLGSIGLILLSEFFIGFQFSAFFSAFIRLVASFSAILTIYVSHREIKVSFISANRNEMIFRIIAFIMFNTFVILVANGISVFLNIPEDVVLGGLIVIFCGILQLGISSSPSKIILGIILIYVGFSSMYCIIESSLLVNGLISAVILILGGLGTYFVIREVKDTGL
jgi:hypothetical protein